MQLSARVLIIARDDAAAGPLARGLDELGWRTVTARGVHSGLEALRDLDIEAAIIVADRGAADAESAAAELKAAAAPRNLPVLALGPPDLPLDRGQAFDLATAFPLHPASAALRLGLLVRGAVAEEEMELRMRTFAEHGVKLDARRTGAEPLQVLTVGEPAPRFLGLSHRLRTAGAEVTAAFTAYTAFDFLHERSFDGVVLWSGQTQAEGLSIAAGMRRNTRLFHIPTVLYLRPGFEHLAAEAYQRGVSDVVTEDTPESETAYRVLALARAYRRGAEIRGALERARGSGLMEAKTGLFTRELFAHHLANLAPASAARRRPLSIAVLRLAERPDLIRARAGGWLERAVPQIGSMIGRLVRVEDTAARLGPEVFALALPAATLTAARAAAERVAAVIACTAFPAGPDEPPFTVEFKIGAAEVDPTETPSQALERAALGALERRAG